MISIIICSVNAGYLSQVRESISSTIGIEYELLVWNNLHEGKGLCEVYNTMARNARFDYICFLHEDILFDTKNWGHKLLSIFSQHPEAGAIGVAGSKYKTSYYSGWFTGMKQLDCANILHRYPDYDEHILLKPSPSSLLEEAVCLDGVFICCRKKNWEQIKFDEQHLRGFHFYDIDFSLRMAAVATIFVTYEISIIHLTQGGNFGDSWVKVAFHYHELKKDMLPFSKTKDIPAGVDLAIVKTWLDVLKNHRIGWRNKRKWVSHQNLLGRLGLYYSILKFFLYKPLGLRRIHKSRIFAVKTKGN